MKKQLLRLVPCIAAPAVAVTMLASNPAFAQDGAAAPAAAVAAAPKSAGTGKALALLPADSDVVFALDFSAFSNQKSLLSFFPRQELEKMVAEQVAKAGAPKPTSPSEAAMRAALLPGLSSKIQSFAVSAKVDIAAQGEPVDSAVLAGTFTKTDATEALKTLGATASADGKSLSLVGQGTETFTIGFPSDGVLVISRDAAFATAAAPAAEAGLTAKGSNFTKTFSTTGAPDVFVYLPGDAVRKMAGQDQMAAMMVAPLLKADGLMLSLRAGDKPVAELTAAFADEQNALIGKQFFEQGLQAIKANIAGSAQNITDPAQKTEIDNAMKKIEQLKVSSAGTVAKVTFDVSELPEREKFQAQVLEKVKEALEGSPLAASEGGAAPAPADVPPTQPGTFEMAPGT